jgi:hypothetical protein
VGCELIVSLINILYIPYLPMLFLPFFITALVHSFLIFFRERIVCLFCDLEFEINGDLGARGRDG